MKADIHPRYYPDAQVVCSCGNTFNAGATQPTLRVRFAASATRSSPVSSESLTPRAVSSE